MNPIKAILLALPLLASSISVMSQTKYEYAVITYAIGEKVIRASIDGKEFREIPLDREERSTRGDLSPALTQINLMTEDHWELFNTSSHTFGKEVLREVYSFYLRRPKQ